MNTRLNRYIFLVLLLFKQTTLSAQINSTPLEQPIDSVVSVADSIPVSRSFFKKFLDYFNDANKEKKDKKFDFSVIGGPHYSSDTKFGLGLVAAGCTVLTGMIQFYLLPIFLFTEMSLQLVFIC